MSEVTVPQVEEWLLGRIDRNLSTTLGVGQHGFVAAVAKQWSEGAPPSPPVIAEALWNLIGKGLAYIDFSNDRGTSGGNHADPSNWRVSLTKRGREYDAQELPNPDLPDRYLQSFLQAIPDASDLVKLYINEALRTYGHQAYIASAVMLGVAAEAAFLEMAEAFHSYLPQSEAQNLRTLLDSPKSKYSALLDAVRKRLEVRKGDFDPDLVDKLDLLLNSTLELIRIYRNDSGHPTGFRIDRAECHQSLVSFAYTARRLYALKAAFEAKSTQGQVP